MAASNEIVSLIESAAMCEDNDLAAIEKDIKEIASNNHINDINKLIIDGVRKAINTSFSDGIISESHQTSLSSLINHFSLDQDSVNSLLASGYESAVEHAFEDGILSEEEEEALSNFSDAFNLDKNLLDRNGAFSRLVKGCALREVMEGNIPSRININGTLPFNFQKNEQLVWLWQGVDYYEQKKRTQYVGGSQGFSVRIAKGLYYRAGAYKGRRIEYDETVHADTGLFGVTDKHIYFSGQNKSFRIRLDKIVTFEPYEDGIGVQRDAATAKPQIFVNNDGWFTHNLITNIAQL